MILNYNLTNQGQATTSASVNFTVTPSVGISFGTVDTTTDSLVLNNTVFTSAYLNEIATGEIVATNNSTNQEIIIILSDLEINQIKTTGVLSSIDISGLNSNQAYKIIFNFTTPTNQRFTTQYTTANNATTRKVAPSLTTVFLNDTTYLKNNNSIMTNTFTNLDAAPIQNIVINNSQVATDQNSSMTSAIITQNVGSTWGAKNYTISGFNYFDGVETQFMAANFDLNYTVLKTAPSAQISNLSATQTSTTFDYLVTDLDYTIVGTSLQAEIFLDGNTTTPAVPPVNVSIVGGNVTIIGLEQDQKYDLYISGTYNLLNGDTTL